MPFRDRFFIILGYYAVTVAVVFSAYIVGSLFMGLFILKGTPNTFTTFLVSTLSYLTVIALISFIMFSRLADKNPDIKYGEVLIFIVIIMVIHLIIVFFGRFDAVSSYTSTLGLLVNYLYNGDQYIMSIRDIPRYYFYLVRLLKDVVFLVSASIGFLQMRMISKNTGKAA